ncbi:glycosyl transferase family 2 [Cyanobacterium stanieri PCC 7202]|uniref:Glycosyl transferase family 2 n=1 Tax=Cyanobacterium stanieri (strain ATCC 29140 / PCC 7202) TaxID=292563 RepID=K9YJ51_CYASC|nr:glycosyl transferase family 2 [Cyanobacterium stanieri PCC 7202]
MLKNYRIYPATAIILSFLIITISIFSAWLTGEETVSRFFSYITHNNPPIWLTVPNFESNYLLYLPALISIIFAFLVNKIFQRQNRINRLITITVLTFLMVRYILWRSFSSLNFENKITGIFSLLLLGIELFFIFSPFLQNLLMLGLKFRNREADKLSQIVREGDYQPMVDIFIPTYNEPYNIIKKTIVACQGIDYQQKKVYLLDDGDRKEIAQLADNLGCHYITRSNNDHAKAGNLNNALKYTEGEIIAVFDADFIPKQNFLTRTVGFFQKQKLALLQTYQSFYSPDPVVRNLSLENDFPPDVEIFSRHYQVIRDSWHSALCYGSSFLVRREHLLEIGGFCQNSLSEDYHTGVKLSAWGYEVAYLNESLSVGLSAENIFGHIRQRQRWARGTIQSLFIPENPLTIRGLNFWQRLAHFEGIVQWFTSPLRIVIFFLPLVYTAGILPIKASGEEIVYFVVPYYCVQVGTFAWLNFRSRSAMISEVYNIVTTFPVAWEVVQTLITPFASIFKVTPKGTKCDRYYFNWSLASPLCFVLAVNVVNLISIVGLIRENSLGELNSLGGVGLILFWNIYNLIIISLSLWAMLDVPKPNNYEWFNVFEGVKLVIDEHIYQGIMTQISDVGACMELNYSSSLESYHQQRQGFVNNNQVSDHSIEMIAHDLYIMGEVIDIINDGDKYKIKIFFHTEKDSIYRQLITKVYRLNSYYPCSVLNTASELKTLYLLLKSLIVTPWRWINYSFYQQTQLSSTMFYPLSMSRNGSHHSVLISSSEDEGYNR